MFALFGEISFEVIGSPEVFESSRRFDYAEHRVVEDRPRLQWLAADLESITLAMLFHISFTDPAAQLAALLSAAYDHQARALVLGNGVFTEARAARDDAGRKRRLSLVHSCGRIDRAAEPIDRCDFKPLALQPFHHRVGLRRSRPEALVKLLRREPSTILARRRVLLIRD
jgi:Phage P2 GpU